MHVVRCELAKIASRDAEKKWSNDVVSQMKQKRY